jgi:uncharacterized protein YkwD
LHLTTAKGSAAILALLLAAGALTAAPVNAAAPILPGCAGADLAAAQSSPPVMSTATVCLVNLQRAAAGMPPLLIAPALSTAAQRHARSMARKRFFSHSSPKGGPARRVRRTGFASGAHRWSVGEAIAWGSGSASTPASIVQMWLASPQHRGVILGSFAEAGVGVAKGRPSGRRGSKVDPNSAIYVLDVGFRAG